jgi:hypothetical protein
VKGATVIRLLGYRVDSTAGFDAVEERHVSCVAVNRTMIPWSSSSALRRLPSVTCMTDKRNVFRVFVERACVGVIQATIVQGFPD